MLSLHSLTSEEQHKVVSSGIELDILLQLLFYLLNQVCNVSCFVYENVKDSFSVALVLRHRDFKWEYVFVVVSLLFFLRRFLHLWWDRRSHYGLSRNQRCISTHLTTGSSHLRACKSGLFLGNFVVFFIRSLIEGLILFEEFLVLTFSLDLLLQFFVWHHYEDWLYWFRSSKGALDLLVKIFVWISLFLSGLFFNDLKFFINTSESTFLVKYGFRQTVRIIYWCHVWVDHLRLLCYRWRRSPSEQRSLLHRLLCSSEERGLKSASKEWRRLLRSGGSEETGSWGLGPEESARGLGGPCSTEEGRSLRWSLASEQGASCGWLSCTSEQCTSSSLWLSPKQSCPCRLCLASEKTWLLLLWLLSSSEYARLRLDLRLLLLLLWLTQRSKNSSPWCLGLCSEYPTANGLCRLLSAEKASTWSLSLLAE